MLNALNPCIYNGNETHFQDDVNFLFNDCFHTTDLKNMEQDKRIDHILHPPCNYETKVESIVENAEHSLSELPNESIDQQDSISSLTQVNFNNNDEETLTSELIMIQHDCKMNIVTVETVDASKAESFGVRLKNAATSVDSLLKETTTADTTTSSSSKTSTSTGLSSSDESRVDLIELSLLDSNGNVLVNSNVRENGDQSPVEDEREFIRRIGREIPPNSGSSASEVSSDAGSTDSFYKAPILRENRRHYEKMLKRYSRKKLSNRKYKQLKGFTELKPKKSKRYGNVNENGICSQCEHSCRNLGYFIILFFTFCCCPQFRTRSKRIVPKRSSSLPVMINLEREIVNGS